MTVYTEGQGYCFYECTQIYMFVQDLEARLLKSARANEEYVFSDEGLKEMFDANEYEFYEDGRLA